MGPWLIFRELGHSRCRSANEALEPCSWARAAGRDDAEYLEYDECQELLVVGAILDSLLNGNDHGAVTEGYEEWLAAQDATGLKALAPSIARGLTAVISDDAELNELWQENEEDYPAWKANIEKLIDSLERVGTESR